MVAQGVLDFQYEADLSPHGLTSLAVLPCILTFSKPAGSARRSGGMFARRAARAGSTSRWRWRWCS